jgi:hypothetical protein
MNDYSSHNEGHSSAVAEHALDRRPAPKWVALVDDRPIPMPHRLVSGQIIKDQAGIGENSVLLRDFQARNDIAIADKAELDLGVGNVFRTIPRCEAVASPPCHEPAKLAYLLDDEWEITLTPHQTGATLRRLFEVPPDLELLRDYESPHDEPVADDESANFADGPVFRSRCLTITVKVNNNPVTFHKRHSTGLEIKQTAITQKVKIPLDGVLYQVQSDGSLGSAINDAEKVTLKDCDEFRCVTPDDNS